MEKSITIIPKNQLQNKSSKDLLKTFNSKEYWNNRYKKNLTSGAGSYNELAIFKASITNNFIIENNIKSIIDYGVGDGNQLKIINTENLNYIGIDVSPIIIKRCIEIFKNDHTKKFILDIDSNNISAELVLSYDVIYHLIEDNIYHDYMNKLFQMSNKYIIIYAKNENIKHKIHVKFCKFTDFIDTYYKNWILIKYIKNKYPQIIIGRDNEKTSPSDFYIYKKM